MSILTDPDCASFKQVVLFRENPLNIFNRIFSILLLTIGIIGNGLGLYFSILAANFYHIRQVEGTILPPSKRTSPNNLFMRRKNNGKKLWFNEYLLAWFFGINLLNSILIIPSPIIELNFDESYDLRWKTWIWINYIAHLHCPITKTLICFGFLIYVLYFANQMIAVVKPFEYRRLTRIGHINWALVLCFIYALAWYIPIYHWFTVLKISLCPGPDGTWSQFRNTIQETISVNGTASIPSIVVYTYRANAYTWVEGKRWHVYQLFRELFVLILPFTGVLLFKFLVLRKSRSAVHKSMEISPGLRGSSGREDTGFVKSKSPKCNVIEYTVIRDKEAASRLNRKSAESLQHKRTFVVLTIEFFLLLLPVSINQSLMNWWPSRYSHSTIAMIYMFMVLLQIIYVSSTFFINLIFNKYYRSYVTNALGSIFRN